MAHRPTLGGVTFESKLQAIDARAVA